MKVLVTGCEGFIGKYIVKELEKNEQTEIIGLDLSETSDSKIDYFSDNIVNENFIRNIIEKHTNIDVIIHCAALISYGQFNTELLEVNGKGTLNILNLAEQVNCEKVIYISSIPIIGRPKILPIDENHPINPPSTYHITKYMGELLMNNLNQVGIKSVIIRIPSPIGKGMNNKTFLPFIIEKLKNNEAIELNGTGSRKQNYIDVRDIALAVSLCVTKDIENVFNIASIESISNIDLALKCKVLVNSNSTIEFNGVEDKDDEVDWNISIVKAKKELGFIPKHSIDDTIMWMIDSE